MNQRRKIIQNSLWGNINVFMRYGLSFVATAFIAAQLGPVDFGEYQLVLSYLAILEVLTLLNGTHLRNHLVNFPEDESATVHAWIVNSFLMWLLYSVGIFALWFYNDFAAVWLLLLISAGRFLFRFADIVAVVGDARMRSDLAQSVQIVSMGLFNVIRTAVAWAGGGIFGITFVSVIQGFLTASYEFLLSKKKLPVSYPVRRAGFYRQLILGGAALAIMLVLSTIQSRIVGILLNYRMGEMEYGSFQLIFKLFEPCAAIGSILLSANYTTLAHTYKSSRGVFRKRFAKISLITVGSSVFFSSLLLLVPKGLLVRIFGEAYSAAFDSLWMGLGVVISSVLITLSVQYDMLTFRYRIAMCKYASAILLYFLAFFLVGKELSLLAALALSTAVPLMVVLIWLPLYLLRVRK